MIHSPILFQNLKAVFHLGRWEKVESWDYVSWIMEYADGTIVMTSQQSDKARLRHKKQPKYFTLLYLNKKLIDRMEIPENYTIVYRLEGTNQMGRRSYFMKLALMDKADHDKVMIHYWLRMVSMR